MDESSIGLTPSVPREREARRIRNPSELLFVLVLLGNVLLYVGAIGGKSQRTFSGTGSGSSYSTATEGVNHWALYSTLCAFAVSAAIGAAHMFPKRRLPTHSLAALAFFIASFFAGQHWRDLLDERSMDRDYNLEIAIGLPLVTIGGIVGGIAAIALALRWRQTGFDTVNVRKTSS